MIKVYCDKCGKEITGNVNKVMEQIEVTDALGCTLLTLPKETHICDECQHNELTCGFKVGDQVIMDDGRVGVIVDICDCESCKRRGFYEPRVKMEIGEGQIYITDTDKKNGFISFYKIGDQVFGNLDEKWLLDVIKGKKEELHNMKHNLLELEVQLNVVRTLQRRQEREENWSDLTD